MQMTSQPPINLKAKNHIIFWSLSFALFLIFVWIFKDMLTPFVLGIAVAYLLNPIVSACVKIKVPRLVAVSSILLFFTFFIISVVVFSVPPLAREAKSLIENLPQSLDQVMAMMNPYLIVAQNHIGVDYVETVKTFLQTNIGKIVEISGGVAGGLLSGGQMVAGFFTTVLLTPLVAFFMMLEWPKITSWIDDLMPRHNKKTIKALLKKMDLKISGFVRGQLTVSFMLGVLYAIALSIVGLNYGILIGISAGFLSIIPMVGSTVGLIISVVVAWFQVGDMSFVAIIAAIFIVGQILEGNFLTPKLVGDSVGLHPLWVMFVLIAGGSLFGIVGMLLSVPVAAVIGVLLGFGIGQYKASPFYQGEDGCNDLSDQKNIKSLEDNAPKKTKNKKLLSKKS